MKYAIHLLLLLMLAAGVAAASVVVNFGSLDQPYDIGQAPRSIDNVSFSYEPDAAVLDPLNGGSLCGFDAGNNGLQGIPGCVGAQIDTSGIFGTTDGTLILGFNNTPAFGLRFGFQLFAFNGLPLDEFGNLADAFGVTAVFLYQNNPVDVALLTGDSSDGTGFGGNFSFTTGGSSAPFDQAKINFSPTWAINPNNGLPNFGQNIFQIDSMSYDEVPEPASITLFGIAALAIGASRLIKRKQ